MPRPSDTARVHYRRFAESVERAGDSVGPNDMHLSNRLWSAAAALREYADTFAPDDPIPPLLNIGDDVTVTFDNAVVTGIDEGNGKVRVGSPRFYGAGWFEPDQVRRRDRR